MGVGGDFAAGEASLCDSEPVAEARGKEAAEGARPGSGGVGSERSDRSALMVVVQTAQLRSTHTVHGAYGTRVHKQRAGERVGEVGDG